MSSVVETAAEHAAVDHAAEEKLPEEEEKKPPVKEEKNLGKEDKKETRVTSSTSEKTQVPVDTNEPTSEGGNAVIKKDQTEEHLLAVAEEDDGEVKLQEKKVKKMKRRELQQIKQEKLVIDAKKIHLTVDAQQPHLPCGVEQEHLLAVAEEDDGLEKVKLQEKKVKKRKRSELQQNKEEVQVDTGVPLRWCASYCTLLFRKSKTPWYKGSIVLDPELNHVALRDTNETTVDCRHLREGELIYPGLVLEFACHKAEIGKQNLEAKEDLPKKKRNKRGFIEFRLGQAFGHEAGEHLKKVDMIIKSLFEDYSNEMGDSLATNPSEEEVQDGVAEFDDSLADWQAHLRVQKKQAPNELQRYLNEELFPQQKDFDILGWWEMHGPKYPVISCIARDVLAIQASTVASESYFSAGGKILTDHRSRLKSKMVEALVCLQDWLKAADPKTMNKDVEEEECLVFYQLKECHEETAAQQAKDGT